MTSKDIALQNSNGSPNVGAGSPNRGVVSRYGGAWCGIRRDPAEFNPELVNSRPQYRQCCGNVCMRDFTNCELFSILRENLNIAFATDGSLWQNLYFHSSECAYHGERIYLLQSSETVFTARRLWARSWLSAGVCPSVCHVHLLYPDG